MTYLDGSYAFLWMWQWTMDLIDLWQNANKKRIIHEIANRLHLWIVISSFDGFFFTLQFYGWMANCHWNTLAGRMFNFCRFWHSMLISAFNYSIYSVAAALNWGSWKELIVWVCLRAPINESEINNSNRIVSLR